VLGPTIRLPDGTTVRGLGALARALQANSLNNILSTPTLLTLDNFQAKIVVGQNVPFVTGSFASASAVTTPGLPAVNPFQTIERRDVGLTLRIKPQISEGGAIRLEIYQEVSSVDPTSRSGASDLVTNKRSLETKVVVDDGNTIVLGGLIDNTIKQTQEAIPLLGSIPFLGALFRYRQEVRQRTNLMIFLRPVIVRSAEDSYRVTSDRYDYLRAFTRGEGEEREAIFDRLEPVSPSEPPARAPGQDAPAAPAKQPDAGAGPAPARP
jgi:general secretion pathway protein D